MLLIIIIIVITTAAAAVSVENTTAEVRAAGRELMTLQARYAAEAYLVSSLTWIDKQRGSLKTTYQGWQDKNATGTLNVRANTHGHDITNPYLGVARVRDEMLAGVTMNVLPVSAADTSAPIPDPTGSFGPNQVYQPAPIEIDWSDCAPVDNVPGCDGCFALECTMTAYSRLVIAGSAAMQWSFGNQDRFGAAHTSRAIVITAPERQDESITGE